MLEQITLKRERGSNTWGVRWSHADLGVVQFDVTERVAGRGVRVDDGDEEAAGRVVRQLESIVQAAAVIH